MRSAVVKNKSIGGLCSDLGKAMFFFFVLFCSGRSCNVRIVYRLDNGIVLIVRRNDVTELCDASNGLDSMIILQAFRFFAFLFSADKFPHEKKKKETSPDAKERRPAHCAAYAPLSPSNCYLSVEYVYMEYFQTTRNTPAPTKVKR